MRTLFASIFAAVLLSLAASVFAAPVVSIVSASSDPGNPYHPKMFDAQGKPVAVDEYRVNVLVSVIGISTTPIAVTKYAVRTYAPGWNGAGRPMVGSTPYRVDGTYFVVAHFQVPHGAPAPGAQQIMGGVHQYNPSADFNTAPVSVAVK